MFYLGRSRWKQQTNFIRKAHLSDWLWWASRRFQKLIIVWKCNQHENNSTDQSRNTKLSLHTRFDGGRYIFVLCRHFVISIRVFWANWHKSLFMKNSELYLHVDTYLMNVFCILFLDIFYVQEVLKTNIVKCSFIWSLVKMSIV